MDTLGSKMSGLARVFSRCKKKLAIWSSVVNNLGIFDLSNHLASRTISLSPEGLISWLYGSRHGWLIHINNDAKMLNSDLIPFPDCEGWGLGMRLQLGGVEEFQWL